LALAVLAVVAAACGGSSSRTVGTASTENLIIGQIGPELGSLSWMGRPQEVAVRRAVQDINSEGGVLGKPVILHAVKDAPASEATTTGKQLLEANVDAVIGAPSGGTASFSSQMASNGVVQCLPDRTASFDANIETGSTTFSTAPPVSATAAAIVAELVTQKVPSVVIAEPNSAESSSLATAISDQLKAHHVPTTTVTYDPNASDFGPVATQILAHKPKSVALLAGPEGPALMKALIGAGAAPGAIIGGPGLFTPTLVSSVGGKPSTLNGMYVAGPGGSATFDAVVGQTTGNDLLGGAQAYDCAVIIALAAEEAKSTDPSVFASHIEDVTTGAHPCGTYPLCKALLGQGKTIAYSGAAGPLRLNSQNEPTSAREVLGYFNNAYLGQATYRDYPISASS
jgi:branched-chain amino acid transport system substrate-binding protein